MNRVSIESAGGNRYVVSGPLQFDTVTSAWKVGLRLLDQGEAVVFDLGQVTRSDSAGLALLVEWVREARRRRTEVHFENIPEQMQAIARASGLDSILPLGAPRTEAGVRKSSGSRTRSPHGSLA